MAVVLTQGYRSSQNGHQYYYEDVREGHNIGYLGDSRMPLNSVTFTPIFGPEPTDHYNTSAGQQSYAGSSKSPEYQTVGNATDYIGAWIRLGNKKIPTVQRIGTGVSTADTADWYGNVLAYNWLSAEADEQPLYMNVGDDTGATKMVHLQSNFYGIGESYYGNYLNYQMNDDDELFSQLPNYSTSNSATTGLGGGFAHSYKSGGSATYRGFHELTYYSNSAGYMVWKPYINFKRNGTSTVGRYTTWANYRNVTYLGTFNGQPYYLEVSQGQYEGGVAATTHFSVHSYDVDNNTMTEEFNGDKTHASSWGANYDSFSQAFDHNSGVTDGYSKGPSKWMTSEGGAYRWLMIPTYTFRDYPTHNMLRMKTSDNTFAWSGYTTATHQPAMYSFGGNVLAYNDWDPAYSPNPVPGNKGGSQAVNKQPGLAAIMTDWHGVYDVNDGEYYGPDHTGAANAQGNGICNQLHSWFPAYGVQGHVDGSANAKYRRIMTWSWRKEPNAWTSGTCATEMYWRGFTEVPETPHQWAWLDEKRSLIAAICQNNTYIYECRGHTVPQLFEDANNYMRYIWYIGDTGTNGANMSLISGYNNYGHPHTFNMNPGASYNNSQSFMGWVHVNTIPHRVVQMGVDKHGKIFAITANITSLGGTNGYGGNLHMWTMNTPFSVALAGNVMTDTITHSGSNIDKTLTIEALGIRGRRVKTKVQLEIVGTTGQFDNGTQSKEVTTSTGGTVSETVTITGSSQFNIVANFGV